MVRRSKIGSTLGVKWRSANDERVRRRPGVAASVQSEGAGGWKPLPEGTRIAMLRGDRIERPTHIQQRLEREQTARELGRGG